MNFPPHHPQGSPPSDANPANNRPSKRRGGRGGKGGKKDDVDLDSSPSTSDDSETAPNPPGKAHPNPDAASTTCAFPNGRTQAQDSKKQTDSFVAGGKNPVEKPSLLQSHNNDIAHVHPPPPAQLKR
eukprot:1996212-Rhodomonas_salina.1